MSEKTTKQSFLNFIFKETLCLVTSGPENGKEGNTLDIPPDDQEGGGKMELGVGRTHCLFKR